MSIRSIISRSGGAGRSPRAGRHAQPPALRAPRSRHRARRSFTLIELLAALAVFSVIMLLLMRFTNAANTTWTKSAANMRVYANARAVMDLIEQDVNGMILSTDPGAEIQLHDHGGVDDNFLTFVSAVGYVSADPADNAYGSKLVEVTYQWVDDGTNRVLKRREIGDSDGTDWDFLGAPAPPAVVTAWYDTAPADSFETITAGVTNFEMAVHPSAASPAYITVSLSLIDDRIPDTIPDTVAKQTERTFTRIFFLNP
ncbi:MAG: prepilin-type N-terminal cleavage/methylation domain-containing protein [Lentisphaeria bacterium]|nr:prepilin-type N-terminal cleavage/methylation domain-containing protein [Lentisphaeria bacterium]